MERASEWEAESAERVAAHLAMLQKLRETREQERKRDQEIRLQQEREIEEEIALNEQGIHHTLSSYRSHEVFDKEFSDRCMFSELPDIRDTRLTNFTMQTVVMKNRVQDQHTFLQIMW